MLGKPVYSPDTFVLLRLVDMASYNTRSTIAVTTIIVWTTTVSTTTTRLMMVTDLPPQYVNVNGPLQHVDNGSTIPVQQSQLPPPRASYNSNDGHLSSPGLLR